tara:strand:+ start:486 stop:1028 length:543 start_codon:yes stop_codon:yes gene_type:complete
MPPYDTRFGLSQSVADYLNQGLPSISNIFNNNITAPIANPIMQNTQPNFMGLTPEQLQLLRLQKNLVNQGQRDGRDGADFAPNPKVEGIFSLKEFLQNIPTPMNLARRGLDSLRGFAMRRREQKQADIAQKNMPDVYTKARDEGFTNDRGGFSTSAADKAGTSEGSGQFSPSTSRGRSGY